MKRRALVIDTCVLVAGLISGGRDTPVTRLVDAMLDGRAPYLLSPDLLAEYRRVLLRARLVELHGLTTDDVDNLLLDLTANAIWREPAPASRAPDSGDDHLWALLDTQPHAVLVTGDRLLLERPFAPNRVITPRQCVEAGLAD